MADFNNIYGEAFATCKVVDNYIMFSKNFSREELMKIYTRFSNDLLGCKIPHYRVVGIWFKRDDRHTSDALQCNDIYGMSVIELGRNAQYMIPMTNGGSNPERGCFLGINETDVRTVPSFEREYGWAEVDSSDDRRMNILRKSRNEIGSLMIDNLKPDERYDYEKHPENFKAQYTDEEYNDNSNIIREINTSNVWYTTYGHIGTAPDMPKMLLPGLKIANLDAPRAESPCTFFFIMRGTGTLTYEDTQELWEDHYRTIHPCYVRYNLAEFFTCAFPMGNGGNSLRLCYGKFNIDKDVLTVILNEYGKEIMA